MAAEPKTIWTQEQAKDIAPPGAYEATACPACGESRGEAIFAEECEGVPIAIRICASCGLGYSTPRPTEAYKVERYARWAQSETRLQAEAHFDHRQQLRHFDLYKNAMREFDRRIGRGRLLDVGCAGGLFLAMAAVYASDHNAGFNSRYQPEGAAFDPGEAELARRVAGVPVYRIAELSRVESGRYDGITLLNVLEHVNRPVDLLRELRRLLRPGGALIVIVPNNTMAFWKQRRGVGRRQESFAANEHILHFRPAPLQRLLRQTGFTRVAIKAPHLEQVYGSLVPAPAKQRAKHTAYRVLELATAQRVFAYPEIVAVAQ